MNVDSAIKKYLLDQPESKRIELEKLHRGILNMNPMCRLWFLDGKNEKVKVVSNPSIGYGSRIIKYANGKSREFYQIGLSANTLGISVYVMGVEDKGYLSATFGKRLGRATVTGYCIRFKRLEEIDFNVLEEVFRFGLENGRL